LASFDRVFVPDVYKGFLGASHEDRERECLDIGHYPMIGAVLLRWSFSPTLIARSATTKDENPLMWQEGLDILDILVSQNIRRSKIMPSTRNNGSIASVVHEICCGLDVHKNTITACLLSPEAADDERSEVMEFGNFTDDLIRLRDWLLEREFPVVAMESAGSYWTPIHNILEDYFQIILVNARHMRNLPGRKTDISDSR
jgi:hypothetical protein